MTTSPNPAEGETKDVWLDRLDRLTEAAAYCTMAEAGKTPRTRAIQLLLCPVMVPVSVVVLGLALCLIGGPLMLLESCRNYIKFGKFCLTMDLWKQ